MSGITNEQLEKIYTKVTGFSVLEAEEGESLDEVIRKNTAWFEDWVHECEQQIWDEVKALGIDALYADEVLVK